MENDHMDCRWNRPTTLTLPDGRTVGPKERFTVPMPRTEPKDAEEAAEQEKADTFDRKQFLNSKAINMLVTAGWLTRARTEPPPPPEPVPVPKGHKAKAAGPKNETPKAKTPPAEPPPDTKAEKMAKIPTATDVELLALVEGESDQEVLAAIMARAEILNPQPPTATDKE